MRRSGCPPAFGGSQCPSPTAISRPPASSLRSSHHSCSCPASRPLSVPCPCWGAFSLLPHLCWSYRAHKAGFQHPPAPAHPPPAVLFCTSPLCILPPGHPGVLSLPCAPAPALLGRRRVAGCVVPPVGSEQTAAPAFKGVWSPPRKATPSFPPALALPFPPPLPKAWA